MKSFLFLLAVSALAASGASAATVKGAQAGNAYFVLVTNPGDKEVRCVGRVFANYIQQGDVGTANTDIIGTVPANSENFMLSRWTTPWASQNVSFIQEVQCS